MKVASIVVATGVALALQTTLTRLITGRDLGLDLVLVAVIYAALSSGPITGMFAGTFAGLVQDALSTGAGVGVIGIGGLSKTVVGFLTGIVGTQFIVAQALPRFVIFLVGSLAHEVMFTGLYALLGLRQVDVVYTTVLWQCVGNAVVGVVVFQFVDILPGSVERRRMARTKTRH